MFLNYEESVDSGGVYFSDENIHLEQMKNLSYAAEFFKKERYDVAAWFWALMADKKLGFTTLCDFDGNDVTSFACPTDEKFVSFAAETVADIAKTGVDMIVFNDDFRY